MVSHLLIAFALSVTLSTAPTIAIDDSQLHPTNDSPGTWDQVFTHDELEEMRSVGGLTSEMRDLIAQRLTAPEPQDQPGIARSTGSATSTPTSGSVNWAGVVSSYPWSQTQALRVIQCESNGNPNAVNPSSGASGGWQFMPFWHSQVDPFDPVDATRFAFVLWQDGGGSFSPHWNASKGCWG